MASITLKDVNKCYRSNPVIRNVNLTAEDGKCTVLVGPSGCGKSTLLRLICGLEEADSGEILIGERYVNDVPPAKRGIAMVFQSYALYPHMTVFENMAFALRVRQMRKEDIEKRVMETAKILKIEELLNRKPKELSGGQRQRVAIGRATVRNPYAFLFDEPLSNLDCALRWQMRYELARLKSRLDTTMVYVTHDQAEAMTLADKIVVMRDGAVEQTGTPAELYNSPVNVFVAKFIGAAEMNIFSVYFLRNSGKLRIFATETGEQLSVCCDLDNLIVDRRYYIGVRPEDVSILSALSASNISFGNKLEASLALAENLGGDGFLHAILKDGNTLTAKTKTMAPPNSELTFGFPVNRTLLFDNNQALLSGVGDAVTAAGGTANR